MGRDSSSMETTPTSELTMKTSKSQSYAELMEQAASYVAEVQPLLVNPVDVANIMRPLICSKPQEELWVLCMNTKHRLIKMEMVCRGAIDRCTVDKPAIFRHAILAGASSFILVHNHPSGDTMPSNADSVLTKEIDRAAEFMGIRMLDHIIVSVKTTENTAGYFSFRDSGLLR